jgi:hypothetical protein
MKSVRILLCLLIAAWSTTVPAADDPSIKGETRTGVQAAMDQHIQSNVLKGKYIIYDSLTGKLHRLVLKGLHEGIVKKGEFYVSCADFTDQSGKMYDIDFLAAEKDSSFQVLQALVHSVEGKKRKYHVEDE